MLRETFYDSVDALTDLYAWLVGNSATTVLHAPFRYVNRVQG
jgi:hypothetical protein